MPSGAIIKQSVDKNNVKTTQNVLSFGDNSNNFKSSVETYINGDQRIVSDNITKSVIQNDNINVHRGNNISDTVGNSSNFTNELNEGAYGSRIRMIGNPDIVYKQLHKDADKLKAEIIAARSGFNDDRDETDFNIINGLSSIPNKVLDAFTTVDNEIAEGDDVPLSTNGSNLLLAMASDVATEVSKYTSVLNKISAAGQLKKAELVAKNEIEKKRKQLELIEKLPESASKERILAAIKKGDIASIFADPSNENKDKKSVYDKNEYEAKVAEILPQLIELEKQNC